VKKKRGEKKNISGGEPLETSFFAEGGKGKSFLSNFSKRKKGEKRGEAGLIGKRRVVDH